MKKAGRNDPCPCGSGKKYKKCCLAESGAAKDRPAVVEPMEAVIDRIDALSNQVPDLLEAGNIPEAERVARRLLDEYPQDPDGIERMAEVLEAKGEDQQAAEYYRRAARYHLDADPDHGREPADYYLAQAQRLDPRATGLPGQPPGQR
jgi:tetratricopeptide (TPR) repeat protein